MASNITVFFILIGLSLGRGALPSHAYAEQQDQRPRNIKQELRAKIKEGEKHYCSNDYTAAEKAFQSALTLKKDDLTALLSLARTLSLTDRTHKQLPDVSNCLDIGSLTKTDQADRLREAIRLLEEAKKLSPQKTLEEIYLDRDFGCLVESDIFETSRLGKEYRRFLTETYANDRCHFKPAMAMKSFHDPIVRISLSYPYCCSVPHCQRHSVASDGSTIIFELWDPGVSGIVREVGDPSPLWLTVRVYKKTDYAREVFKDYHSGEALVPKTLALTIGGLKATKLSSKTAGAESQSSFIRQVEIIQGDKLVLFDFRYSTSGNTFAICCASDPNRCKCLESDIKNPGQIDRDIDAILNTVRFSTSSEMGQRVRH